MKENKRKDTERKGKERKEEERMKGLTYPLNKSKRLRKFLLLGSVEKRQISCKVSI